MIQAGRLNKRVTIQRKSATLDSFGAEVLTWSTVATVWAGIEPLSGREFFASQQINAEISTRIRIRYLAGIISAMQVVYGTKTYNVLSVIDVKETHAEMQLMCSEKVV